MFSKTKTFLAFCLLFGICPKNLVCAADPVFSGPQVGEKLTPFGVTGYFEPNFGKELNFVKAAGGKPIVLVFIHDANRPSLRFTQVLSSYSIGVENLHTGIVWLADDVTEAENFLKRSGHALTHEAPTGISPDGREGPGGYGLNRNVTLTVLVGKEDRVTANFALIQPSIQADLPKVLQEISKVAGIPPATLEDLLIIPDIKLQGPLSQLVQRNAKDEDVELQASNIERAAQGDEAVRKELGRVTTNLVKKGTLSKHGTARAQAYLKKWAKEYGGIGFE